jgi:hypothetical protein
MAWADTAIIRPDGDVEQGADWDSSGCSDNGYYDCVNDQTDASYVFHYDNNSTSQIMFTMADPEAQAESVDSATFVFTYWSDLSSNAFRFLDSLSEDVRSSSTITTTTTSSWVTDSVTYSLSTNNSDAWDWEAMIDLCTGISITNKGNNKTLRIGEIYARIWWTTGSNISYVRRRMVIQGDQ